MDPRPHLPFYLSRNPTLHLLDKALRSLLCALLSVWLGTVLLSLALLATAGVGTLQRLLYGLARQGSDHMPYDQPTQSAHTTTELLFKRGGLGTRTEPARGVLRSSLP